MSATVHECAHCQQIGATASFECSKCPRINGTTCRFWVCDRKCQVPFWKVHKKTHIGVPPQAERMNHGFLWESSADDFGTALTDPQSWARQMGEHNGAEWIVDCYRMRVDDDVQWASNPHGLYEIIARTNGNGDFLSKEEKTFIITRDFLVFFKLAVRNNVVPENFAFKLCLEHFAPNLLPYHFDKQDAKAKWGGENVFSPRPSLRRTAERVYGLSCMSPYHDVGAQAEGERIQDVVMSDINTSLGQHYDNFVDSESEIFENVGGKDVWVALFDALLKNM